MKRSKQFYTICATTLMTLAAWGLLNQAQADTVSQSKQPATAQTSPAAGQTVADSSASSSESQPGQDKRLSAGSTVSQANAPARQAAINQNAAARPAVYNRTQADALDISWMNANMNQGTFEQMKAQGVKHVIIQLTKGTYMHDPYAVEQVRDAYHAGLGVAVYHFAKFNSHNSAIAEANYFADRADQLHLSHNVLMIADVEDCLNMYGGVANDLRAFFNQLNARGYWNHAVYTGQYFDSRYHVSSVVGRNRTWIAQYPYDHQATPARIKAKAAAGYGAWQYTGYNGGFNVAGYGSLDGSVDLGLFRSAIGNGFRQAAYLDTFKLDPGNNRLDVAGWFASLDSRGRDSHYVFLLDGQGREIARQQVSAGARPDVKQAYYYLDGAENSGFSVSFSLNDPRLRAAIANGTPMIVDFRDSADPAGNQNYVEYRFPAQSLVANAGWLDAMTLQNGQLHVSGWQVSNRSLTLKSRWVIVYDQTSHRELGRVLADSVARPDVLKAYPNVYGAETSGYQANFDLAKHPAIAAAIMNGHQLQVVARYSDDAQNGEGQRVDYWNPAKSFGSRHAAWLDNFGWQGQPLHASGWYADDRSGAASHRYVILFDQTRGRELARQEVQAEPRTDVARAYPQIANANLSGFSVDFALNPAIASALQQGDALQIIARYSDAANGEGNYCQNWFPAQRFLTNAACLDRFNYEPGQGKIVASGWHCADQAAGRAYHLDILWDATTGRELSRVQNPTSQRLDVAQAYPHVYNSQNAAFTVTFALNDAIKAALADHHQLKVVDRYAATADGNSNYIDYWLPARQL